MSHNREFFIVSIESHRSHRPSVLRAQLYTEDMTQMPTTRTNLFRTAYVILSLHAPSEASSKFPNHRTCNTIEAVRHYFAVFSLPLLFNVISFVDHGHH